MTHIYIRRLVIGLSFLFLAFAVMFSLVQA